MSFGSISEAIASLLVILKKPVIKLMSQISLSEKPFLLNSLLDFRLMSEGFLVSSLTYLSITWCFLAKFVASKFEINLSPN